MHVDALAGTAEVASRASLRREKRKRP